MNENDPALLNDMLEFSWRVVGRVEGKQFEDLAVSDYLLGDSVLRAIEVIGEAASHVSAELKTQHPEIQWPRIVGMRNRLIHGYTRVDWKVVWETATEAIPMLIRQLEAILREES